MNNEVDEKAINESAGEAKEVEVKESGVKEAKKSEDDKIETCGKKAKNVIDDMKSGYKNASPAMQKTIIAVVVATVTSILTMLKTAALKHCVSKKKDETKK